MRRRHRGGGHARHDIDVLRCSVRFDRPRGVERLVARIGRRVVRNRPEREARGVRRRGEAVGASGVRCALLDDLHDLPGLASALEVLDAVDVRRGRRIAIRSDIEQVELRRVEETLHERLERGRRLDRYMGMHVVRRMEYERLLAERVVVRVANACDLEVVSFPFAEQGGR